MIAVKTERGQVQMSFPTEGMSPDEVNEFVTWLRVEGVARRSQLTPETALRLGEDIKAGWWSENEQRFCPPEAK